MGEADFQAFTLLGDGISNQRGEAGRIESPPPASIKCNLQISHQWAIAHDQVNTAM